MRILVSCLLTLAALPAQAVEEGTHPATGLWLTENGKAIVEFAPCDGQVASPLKPRVCGQIVWAANPRDAAGNLKRDVNNPDTSLRDRALCGLTLVGGLEPDSTGKLREGWIYNPRSGSTFGAEAELVSPERLKLRGFLGISLLGKSQVWTRVADNRGGC